MLHRFALIIPMIILPLLKVYGARPTRSELNRYRLLRDRMIIDRDLKKESLAGEGRSYERFFDLDLSLSSGIKSLAAEISNASDNSSGTSLTSSITNTLLENINAEWYVDANLLTGFPLPYIKHKKHRFLPSIFYELNMSFSASINNQNGATTPEQSLYFKKDKKIGLFTRYKKQGNSSAQLGIALYHLSRSDSLAERSASQVASAGKFFNFDDLNLQQKSFNADIRYLKKYKHTNLMVEVKELQLWSLSSDKGALIGTSPLLHIRSSKEFFGEKMGYVPFIGFHFRKHHTVAEGFYLGSKIHNFTHIPLEATFKMSNQFMGLITHIKTKWFHFNYHFKTPYRNPQDNIWVSAVHTYNLNIPFP